MKRLYLFRKRIAILCFLTVLLLTGSAQAITYNFDDGTNQGWTVEYNTGSGETPAGWFDYTNYSGSPTAGRPPLMTPSDPTDNNGAIMGSGPVDSLALFSSPVFTQQSMDSISAMFCVSSLETGISDSTSIFARVGYHNSTDDTLWWGLNFDIDSTPALVSGYHPLWTEASIGSIDNAHVIDQIFVVVGVNGTVLVDGTQNWVDSVTSAYDPGNPDPGTIPEPGTLILFGIGLLGLSSLNRKKIG